MYDSYSPLSSLDSESRQGDQVVDASETSEELDLSTFIHHDKTSVVKAAHQEDEDEDPIVSSRRRKRVSTQRAMSSDGEYDEEHQRRKNSRFNSDSSGRSSQSSEVKALQKVGAKWASASVTSSWATRPKRNTAQVVRYQNAENAARRISKDNKSNIETKANVRRQETTSQKKAKSRSDSDDYNHYPAQLIQLPDTTPDIVVVPKRGQGRPKKELKRKASPLDDYVEPVQSNAETSTPRALKKPKKKTKEVGLIKEENADASNLSSYDSLFDGILLSSKADETPDSTTTIVKKKAKAASPIKHARMSSDSGAALESNVFLELDYAKFRSSLIIVEGKSYLPQFKQCITLPNAQQCRHCVSRQAGDSCRFLSIRAFPIRQRGKIMEVLGQYGASISSETGPIFISDRSTCEKPELPNHYDLNRPMDDDTKKEIMTTAAISLVGILEEGLKHAQQPNFIQRARELQIRAMCDYCSTGIFSASFMCTRCGCEYCIPCKKTIETLTESEQVQTQLCTCVKDKRSVGSSRGHSASMMIPVTRFSAEELQQEVAAMKEIIQENGSKVANSTMKAEAKEDVEVTVKQFDDETPLVIPSQPLTIVSKTVLDKEQFLATWAKGEPLVVTNVSTEIVWDPNTFIERYGWMDCEIVRCDARPPMMTHSQVKAKLKEDPNYFTKWAKYVKVHEFFETFGKADEERVETFGKGIWKLKDWPPAAEFSSSFPDIYKDFNYAVPMPDFTRRDGCANISSLFPKNANGPDLGPKMYNAWPGEHTKGKKGTTCLHMDVADAVNILLYTAQRQGTQPTAQWDIFRAEDANAIRDFLREKHPELHGDPIHAQVHYLDDDLLEELYQTKGVYSWRIYQKTGQAVFIPAGCAHQVCNLTDCIKVAVDFISPQNIARCFQLTEEFRGLTVEGKRSWKEDVLQLRAQLWYAWKACRSLPVAPDPEKHQLFLEKKLRKEEKARELEAEALERKRSRQCSRRERQDGISREIYIPRGTSSRSRFATEPIQEQEVIELVDESDDNEEKKKVKLKTSELESDVETSVVALEEKMEVAVPVETVMQDSKEGVLTIEVEDQEKEVDPLTGALLKEEQEGEALVRTFDEKREDVISPVEIFTRDTISRLSSDDEYVSTQEEMTSSLDLWCHTPPRSELS